MQRWLLIVLSLWVVFAVRAYNILALPVFVDESLHILRAQVVFDFTDAVASFMPGKLLVYYYFGLFDPQNQNGLWMTREAIALLAPLSAALSFALVWQVTRAYWASLAVIWLYAITPFNYFFDRMALSDPFTLIFVLATLLASLRLAQQPTRPRAMLTGLMLGLALLAKLTAAPMLLAPPLAMIFARNFRPRYLVAVYGVAFLCLLPSVSYAVYDSLAGENREVVTATLFVPEDRSRVEQIVFNVETYTEATLHLVGIGLIGGVAILAVWRNRPALYLLLMAGGQFTFIVLASAFPSTRYLTIAFPIVLIVLAIGLHELQRPLAYGVVLVPLLIVALPFFADSWQTPTQLELGEQDEWEYFSHTSSAYALREAAAMFSEVAQTRAPLISSAGSCHSLRFYLPEDARLYCLYFPFFDNPALLTEAEWSIAVERTGYTYIVSEGVDAEALGEADVLARFMRPHDGAPVWLLRWENPDE